MRHNWATPQAPLTVTPVQQCLPSKPPYFLRETEGQPSSMLVSPHSQGCADALQSARNAGSTQLWPNRRGLSGPLTATEKFWLFPIKEIRRQIKAELTAQNTNNPPLEGRKKQWGDIPGHAICGCYVQPTTKVNKQTVQEIMKKDSFWKVILSHPILTTFSTKYPLAHYSYLTDQLRI